MKQLKYLGRKALFFDSSYFFSPDKSPWENLRLNHSSCTLVALVPAMMARAILRSRWSRSSSLPRFYFGCFTRTDLHSLLIKHRYNLFQGVHHSAKNFARFQIKACCGIVDAHKPF